LTASAAPARAFAFVGNSGSGKTTLIERLIARFRGEGLRVAAIKHAHHGFDLDVPGKDSWRLREAGATQVLVASPRRWALLVESQAVPLREHLARLAPCDLVLVEGFRSEDAVPFLEVHRGTAGRDPGVTPDARAIGLASSEARELAPRLAPLPVFALDDIESIARFVRDRALPP